MLSSHVIAAKVNYGKNPARNYSWRGPTRSLRIFYVRALLKALRYPGRSFAAILIIFGLFMTFLASGTIRFNFFEVDPLWLFYVGLEMPKGTILEEISKKIQKIVKDSAGANRRG